VEYIFMEYIPGNTLRFTMSEEGLDGEDELLADWLKRYFIPVLNGVEAIHAGGIVHRDLKPENVLMDDETPKNADFGLARSIKMRAVSNSWDVKGTWPYMAPEQFSDFNDIPSPVLCTLAMGRYSAGHPIRCRHDGLPRHEKHPRPASGHCAGSGSAPHPAAEHRR
jgi:serine/threonine protein kinase